MRNNKKIYAVIYTAAMLLLTFLPSNASGLEDVVLSGKKGGLPNGEAWRSSSLAGTANLILYVDPDKKKDAEALVQKIDSLNYDKNTFKVIYILNTAATVIPNFLIRGLLKKKAEKSPSITYILDEKKTLVKKWNLHDDEINVLLIAADGTIVEKHHGKMSKEYLKQFMQKTENLINKGDVK